MARVGALIATAAVAAFAVDSPLFLTPLLDAGDADSARARASVVPLLQSCCESYSGFLTVNKTYNSNLFFWFFRSESDASTAPLVVWLQGGPGTSMMRPVFLENGPYQLAQEGKTMTLKKRRGAWTNSHSVLYFDNPVGTGYSFTGDEAGYARSVEDIAVNLHEALRQFLLMFPDLRTRELYIAGESYGGRMAVGLAHHIHTLNAASPSESERMNLRGLLSVNGLLEWQTQLDKSELAYQLGLVDESGRDEMKAITQEQIRLYEEGRWAEARQLSRDECGGALSPEETGYQSITNFLLYNGTQDNGYIEFARLPNIAKALHVGNATYVGRAWETVGGRLSNDTSNSVLPKLAELANDSNYRILIANGQLDLCIPYRLTSNLLLKMQWRGADEWKTSQRVTWCFQGQLAGYARTVQNLTQVLVRNAGHYLGQDQARWFASMLTRFTTGATFATCELCTGPFT